MKKYPSLLLFLLLASPLAAQDEETNYEESLVPGYTLPDVLVTSSGERITDSSGWINKRRPEILQLFRDHVYGNIPEGQVEVATRTISHREKALEGKATREEVVINLSAGEKNIELNLLIYLPAAAENPVPVFLGERPRWEEEDPRASRRAVDPDRAGVGCFDHDDSTQEELLLRG